MVIAGVTANEGPIAPRVAVTGGFDPAVVMHDDIGLDGDQEGAIGFAVGTLNPA